MSKLSIAFGAAIAIHIIVLLLSGLLIDKEDTNIFNSRNLIDVQFGNGTNNLGGSFPQKQTAKSISKTNSLEKKSVVLNKSPSVAAQSGIGTGQGTGSEIGSGSGISSGENFEASIINYQGPAYPRIAQVRGLQGNIRIRINVSVEGLPQDVSILKSSGHDVLDKAALEVIPRWRFQKKSSPYFVEKNIVFQLKD